jgi:TIR domain
MTRRNVFISYAREDRLEVEAAAELLRAGGVQVFIDVRDIAYGQRWEDALGTALQRCERVLVFWSEYAAASEWVDREWRLAHKLGKRIVPARLDDTPMPPDLAQFHALQRPRRAPAPPSRPRADAYAGAPYPGPAPRQPAPAQALPPKPAQAPRSRPGTAATVAALAAIGAAAGSWLLLGDAPQVSLPPPLPPVSTDSRLELIVGLLLALAVPLAAWQLWRRRRVPAEAARFVREVFSA